MRKAHLAGAALAAIVGAAQAATPENVDAIADGIYTFRAGDQRSLFLVTDKGVIVTDPIDARAAAAYRKAIAAITDKPVRFVVYSHYHWDRVSGGTIFKDEGAKFVAQERCAERFRMNPNAAVVMPDITFKDKYRVALGGKSLELFYFGPSHGDCLTVFLAEPANIMQIVELVNPPRASFPDDPGVPYIKPHNLKQFFRSAQDLAAKRGVKQIVASSVKTVDDGQGGKSVSAATGPASVIADQARFWDAIYSAVEISDAQGRTGMDSFVPLDAIDLEVFKPYDGYDPQALPMIMRKFVGYYDMGR
jgi:hypothetical protein